MAYSFQLFLVVSILFHCYGIHGQVQIDPQIHRQERGSLISNGSYIMQQMTNEIENVGQIFFLHSTNTLLYTDSKVNGSLMMHNLKDGKTERRYIKELAKEKIVTVTPTKKDSNKLLIGSDLNLRLLEIKDKEYTITEPLITFKEEGFVIHAAHADNNGVLFILLRTKDRKYRERRKLLAKFYKVQNKKAQLVKEFNWGQGDFRFNHDCTQILMIDYLGAAIDTFSYNLSTTEVADDHMHVFALPDYDKFKGHCLRSVVADRKPGHLWAIAAGKTGYLIEINPYGHDLFLVSVTPLVSKDLSFITFGADDYRTLYVGSNMNSFKSKGQGSIYKVNGMNRVGVIDNLVDW